MKFQRSRQFQARTEAEAEATSETQEIETQPEALPVTPATPIPDAKPKKVKKAKRPKHEKTAGPWRLFRGTLTDLRVTWKRLFVIMAVVLIPLNIFGLFPSIANDPTASVFAYGAIIILNVAVFWAIAKYYRTGTMPGPGAAYYDGSESLVRFIIILFWLTAMLIPAVISTVLILLALTVAQMSGAPLAETVLIDAVLLLLALPSLWLFVRFGLAPVITVADGLRPWAAFRYSRQLTLGRFWRVLVIYCGLLIFTLIIALPITALAAGLSVVKAGAASGFVFGMLSSFIMLPLTCFYLLRMYRSLQTASVVTREPAHPHNQADAGEELTADPSALETVKS